MPDNSSPRKIDPSIIAALIGVIGTIVVTLITINANKQPPQPTPTPIVIVASPTQAPVIPTDTVPAGDPTSTPAPTDTPVPSPTVVPPVAIGDDWATGCISSFWKPYPADIPTTDKGNGCWQEPVYKFSADAGSLFLVSQRDARGPVEVYGLFAPLPASGKVSFTVHLKKLDNVDFVMGIFVEPDVTKDGALLAVPYSNNIKKLRVVQLNNITDQNTGRGSIELDQGSGFPITFTFSESSVSGAVNPFVYIADPHPLPSAQKWLFLGYRSREVAYNVDVEILSLKLEK